MGGCFLGLLDRCKTQLTPYYECCAPFPQLKYKSLSSNCMLITLGSQAQTQDAITRTQTYPIVLMMHSRISIKVCWQETTTKIAESQIKDSIALLVTDGTDHVIKTSCACPSTVRAQVTFRVRMLNLQHIKALFMVRRSAFFHSQQQYHNIPPERRFFGPCSSTTPSCAHPHA